MDYKKEYYKIKGKYIELSKEVEKNIPKKMHLNDNFIKYTEKTENVNLTRSKIPQVCLDTSNILEFNKDNLHIFKKNIVEAIKKGIRHFLVSSAYAKNFEGLYLQSVGNGINEGIKAVNRTGSKISREDIFITMKGNNANAISIDLDQSRLKYFDLWVFDEPSSLISDDNRKSLELAIYKSKVKNWGINQATSEGVIKKVHELKIGDKNCMVNILQILPKDHTLDGFNSFETTIKICFDFGIVPFLFGIIDGINSEVRPELKHLKIKPLHQMYDDILKYYLVTYLYDKTSVFIIGDEKGLTRERILQLLEDEERNKFEMTEERMSEIQNDIWYRGINILDM